MFDFLVFVASVCMQRSEYHHRRGSWKPEKWLSPDTEGTVPFQWNPMRILLTRNGYEYVQLVAIERWKSHDATGGELIRW